MTVLVDTGPLVAFLNTQDPRHKQSVTLMERIWRGRYGVAIGIDAVLDEGATLLRRRPGRRDLSQRFFEHFFPPAGEPAAVRLVTTDAHDLRRAAELNIRFYDQGLSFTDCLLVGHAQELGAVVATFDGALSAVTPSISGTERD